MAYREMQISLHHYSSSKDPWFQFSSSLEKVVFLEQGIVSISLKGLKKIISHLTIKDRSCYCRLYIYILQAIWVHISICLFGPRVYTMFMCHAIHLCSVEDTNNNSRLQYRDQHKYKPRIYTNMFSTLNALLRSW